MSKYSPLTASDGVRWFVSSRPPLIIIVFFLGFVALLLMTLAFYVQHLQLNRPDISQDWDVFLESFAELEFCIDNGTMGQSSITVDANVDAAGGSHRSTPLPPVSTSVYRGHGEENTVTQPATDSLSRNYSIQMMLEVRPTFDFISIPHNLTYLTGAILGSELGLTGLASEEWIQLAVQLPFEWNTTHCESFFSKKCDLVHIYTCVSLQASEFVFPNSRSPERCEVVNDTGVEYHALIKTPNQKLYAADSCKGRTTIHTRYKLDPKLTVLLSLSDRSVINLHLLHSSYFVFVMTITILLYVIVRGLPIRLKTAHQLVPGSSVNSHV